MASIKKKNTLTSGFLMFPTSSLHAGTMVETQVTVNAFLGNMGSPSLFCTEDAAAKSLQSCLTLCDPRDGSPPGSPVPGTLQVRTLEWVAISFSNT